MVAEINEPLKQEINEPWLRTKTLTEKEKEIFLDLCNLLTYKEIAEKRDIKPKTAKDHAYLIYKKLGISQMTGPANQNRLMFLRVFCDVKPKGEVL